MLTTALSNTTLPLPKRSKDALIIERKKDVAYLDLNPDLKSDIALTEANFGFCSFFAERGMGSGKTYQPSLNHRSMNLSVVLAKHGENNETRSLLDSHASPRSDERFHRNEKITLYGYEVQDKAVSKKDIPLRALHDVKIQKGEIPDAKDRELFGIPKAVDRVAVDLTKQSLKRMMDVLNVAFDGDDYKTPEQLDSLAPMEDVLHFLQHFASTKLRTKEEIRSFMTTYSLFDVITDEIDIGMFLLREVDFLCHIVFSPRFIYTYSS